MIAREAVTGNHRVDWLFASKYSLQHVHEEYEGNLPMMPASAQVVDRGDSCFGIMELNAECGQCYTWHCSSRVNHTLYPELRKQRGLHVQLVYPNRMALEQDQGAHNMCLVDTETGRKLQKALCIACRTAGQSSPLPVFRYMQTYISRMCTEQIVERRQLLYHDG